MRARGRGTVFLVAVMMAACGGGQTPAQPPDTAQAPAAAPPLQNAAPTAAGEVADEPAEDSRPPADFVRVDVLGVAPVDDGGAVLLHDPGSNAVVPIFIGGTEALAISLRLDGREPPRPLTHDLLDAALAATGAAVLRAQVDALRDGVFIGSLWLRTPAGIRQLDSRASDAIAMAIGSAAPVYVAPAVLREAGLDRSALEQASEAPEVGPAPPDQAP